MKTSSKILALLMAVVLGAVMIGCNGGTTSSSTAESTASSESEAPAESSEGSSEATPVASGDYPTLIWWSIGATPDDLSDGLAAINEYAGEQIGVNVDIKQAGWGDWDTKVNTIVNSGEYYDIMFTNNTKYSQFVNMGAFTDITELAQSTTPELWSFIPEMVWDGTKIGGKIYAVPTYKDSSITQYWVFDDVYVQKYNIDIDNIKTMADLDAPFRAMKEGEGRSFYPLDLSQGSLFNGFFNDYDGLTAGLQPLGVRVDDETRTVVSVLEQTDIMENLKLLHSWYQDGIINPDAPTLIEPNKNLPFMAGQGFPGAEITWQINNGVEKYDMFPIFGPMYTTDTIQGSMNAISSASNYKEESLKFLQFANLDHKMRDMLAFGVEGRHFEYNSDNVITKLTDTWTMPSYAQATFFTMSTMSDAPADQWEQVKMLNEQADASVCLGFALDVTDINTEISNCKATWDKYKFEMLTGASDPEVKVAECIAELKANGLDTIIAEAQKQVDEYFADSAAPSGEAETSESSEEASTETESSVESTEESTEESAEESAAE